MAVGSFCLVLHGHLPYVLRHGRTPHGVHWLYEAVAETYLPLLALLEECSFQGARVSLALGLTPVLLEQLAHEDFRDGFARYLAERRALAERDLAEREAGASARFADLASLWVNWYGERLEQFERIGRDVPAAFAEGARRGQLQLLGSAATHAYLPLLCEDSAVRAQVRAGLDSSERILGRRPDGFWLPECAYRPRGPWNAPAPWKGHDDRLGLERVIADEGVTHCFVDHHLVERARSELEFAGGTWRKVGWRDADEQPARGWRSPLEVHGIHSVGEEAPSVHAFARDRWVCEQVWSGTVGYPAHGAYLEFHKRRVPLHGLRYWRVTSRETALADKQLYEPEAIAGTVHEHAQHFSQLVARRLTEHNERTGRAGVLTAAFDAELFGHWWFEGPRFLRDVLLTLDADPRVELTTPRKVLHKQPPDMAVALPEGSWGEGGDHRVWSDPRVQWIWETEYRCEARFGELTFKLPWRTDRRLRELLEMAGRELLLLQSSDWVFAITRGQAVDYGIKRFVLHVARFDALVELCARDGATPTEALADELARHWVADAELHDVVFPSLDLEWWNT
jgi:1,4-alpha-glucan branching enzyme